MAQRPSKFVYGAEYRRTHKKKEQERHRRWYLEKKDEINAKRRAKRALIKKQIDYEHKQW